MLPLSVEEDSPRALIRRYLDRGGKVVLLGANPLAYRADPLTVVVEDIDFAPAEKVFGVHFPSPKIVGGYYASRPTDAGRRWGLRGFDVGPGSIDPVEASEVLAQNDYGMATAWVKSYGGAAGTGLLQLVVPLAAPTNFARYRAAIEFGLY